MTASRVEKRIALRQEPNLEEIRGSHWFARASPALPRNELESALEVLQRQETGWRTLIIKLSSCNMLQLDRRYSSRGVDLPM